VKKIAVTIAGLLSLGYVGAFEMPTFGLKTSVGFQMDGEFRGRQQRKHVVSAKAEIDSLMFDEKGMVYGGVNTSLLLNSLETDRSEVALT
jgi:hypothetical protein